MLQVHPIPMSALTDTPATLPLDPWLAWGLFLAVLVSGALALWWTTRLESRRTGTEERTEPQRLAA